MCARARTHTHDCVSVCAWCVCVCVCVCVCTSPSAFCHMSEFVSRLTHQNRLGRTPGTKHLMVPQEGPGPGREKEGYLVLF
jgi:hypothetical protein